MMLKKIKQRMSEAEKVQVEGAAVKNAWNSMAVFGQSKDSTGATT